MPFCLIASGGGVPPLFCGIFAVSHCRSLRGHPLPLPLGEVAERSEDGEGRNKLVLSFKRRHTAFSLSVTFGDSSPKWRAKGLYTYRASKSTLVSRNSALPRKASKGNRARFLFGGSRVEVFRRRGKRNPRLLNDSLVTFCSHRKSPHGVAGSETLLKGSPSTPAPGRTPAPTPFIYTYAACIPTA